MARLREMTMLLAAALVAAIGLQVAAGRLPAAAAPRAGAPVLSISLVPGKNHVVLAWTEDATACSYEIHRSTDPTFSPGPATLQETLPAGATAYTDYCASRNIDLNYFYVVRAVACHTDAVADSNRVGEFDFPLGAGPSRPAYRVYGLNFSPYIAEGEDPANGLGQITLEELADRLTLLAPDTEWVRMFACGGDLEQAGRFAHTLGLNTAVGAWLDSEATPAGQQANRAQIDCLKAQAAAGHVDLAIVGSEALLRGDLPESQLIAYINEVKQYFLDEGIAVPVTTADVYSVLLAHPNVLAAVDLVHANYYPYWEGKPIEVAVAHLHRWHQQVVAASGGKEVIVSETGWPSAGNQIGEAAPSPENASAYFLNVISWARAEDVKVFYFEAYDETWKAAHEGPQGAHWGVWDSQGVLKPGMQQVFDGVTVPDNWTQPLPATPIINFTALPAATQTNLPTFVVADYTDPANDVLLNGAAIADAAIDAQGNFAVAAPLAEGDNALTLTIMAGGQVVTTTTKHVNYDPSFTTDNLRLLYVDSVAAGADAPPLSGTIVIALDRNTILGLIADKHIVGISPAGDEIYMSDRTVLSTATHQVLRTLAFTADIPGNGFLVSPDGELLYSRDERLDVESNALLAGLPVSIVTGSSWEGAPVPGGPAISPDGGRIYCCAPLQVIDTQANTATTTSISSGFLSDIALTPDESRILLTSYSNEIGSLSAYDAATFAAAGSIGGLGDFVGEVVLSSDGQKALIGSAGNPASATSGRVSAVNLSTFGLISQKLTPLADNLAVSASDEIFVSSGYNDLVRRQGIDVYVLNSAGSPELVKSYFLAINRFVIASGTPQNDQIRRIVFKP